MNECKKELTSFLNTDFVTSNATQLICRNGFMAKDVKTGVFDPIVKTDGGQTFVTNKHLEDFIQSDTYKQIRTGTVNLTKKIKNDKHHKTSNN